MYNLDNLASEIGKFYTIVEKSVSLSGIEFKNELPRFSFHNFLWQPNVNLPLLFSFCARDSFNPVFCQEMIGEIESHIATINLDNATQLIMLENAVFNERQFNCLLIMPSNYHRRLEKIDPEAQKHTFEVYPAWRCELLGTETPQEFDRMTRGGGITFTDWNRMINPCCYSYLFKKTQSLASKKIAWLYDSLANTTKNIRILLGEGKLPAMAMKNFLGQERIVENASSGYRITNRAVGDVSTVLFDDLASWMETYCTTGLNRS